MIVYLAGPIEGCTDSECKDWRTKVISDMMSFWTCLDPLRRDYRGKEHLSKEIVELDKRDILLSDVLLVNFNFTGKPMVGSSMEICFAWENSIPVVVVFPGNSQVSPWLDYHALKICHTIDEAVKWINQNL